MANSRTRIYEKEDYGDLFEAHSKSREYNPVGAFDPSSQYKERTQQRLQDIQMLARGAQRQYELDQMYLKAGGDQGVRSLQLQATQTTTTTEAFKGLLGLSTVAMKTYSTIKENNDNYNAELKEIEAVGLGMDPTIQPTPEQQKHEVEKQTAIKADSRAAAEVATDLEKDGTLEGKGVAHALQQTTVYNSTKGAENNTFAAIAAYPAFLFELKNATPAEKLPKTPAETQAFLLEANRLFFRQTGMYGASHADKVKLARSMAGIGQNFMLQQVSGQIKIERDENLADARGFISTLSDAYGTKTGLTAQEIWNRASGRYLQGNVGYHDNTRGGNRAAMENLLQEAVDSKNMGLLNALRTVEKVPGNKGTALGKEYDDLFDKYERQLRQQAVQDWGLKQSEDKVEVGKILQNYMENPTAPGARRQAIDSLLANGSEEALKQAQLLADKGFNYDPTKAIELERMRSDGQRIDQDMLEGLRRSGTISDDEYKRYSTRGPIAEAEKGVDKFLKSVSGSYKAAMQNNAPATSLTQELKLQLISRHQLFMDELKQSLMMEINVNPNLASDNAALSKLVEQKAAVLMQRPQYKLQRDPDKGWYFQGDLNAASNHVKAWRGSYYDYSSLPAEKIFGPRVGLSFGQVSPGRDRFIPYDSLRSDVKAVLGGKDASNNTRLIAKKFGLSTPAFVDQQLKAYGLPGLSALRESQEGQALMPGANGDIRDASHAMQMFRSVGFPKKSAAYLAGNLQQESGVNGRREWVLDDGAGRNGGIVSWNRGRLNRLEQRYGRNVKQITEVEQLNFMLDEMKTHYKTAYRIFMNPNSTDQELRRASYMYWGFGEVGARYTYATRLETYGRI
jgi:hypothetical protein